MNSKQIQQNYSSIFEYFFTTQKIIFSAPFVLSRSGESGALYSGIGIKQKIPLRMYIGISSHETPGIHFGKIIYKDTIEKQFITTDLHEYAPYIGELGKFIQQYNLPNNEGYTLTILSELPRSVGLGFDSILSLLLATSIYRLQGGHTKQLLLDCHDITEDINNESLPLYHITRIAHSLESQIRGYIHINGCIATSMSHSAFPIITFHEDIQYTGAKNLFSMQDYKYFCYPLNILFPDLGDMVFSPIDYGIIYSGRPTLNEHTAHLNTEKDSSILLENIHSVFKNATSSSSANRKPKFFKTFITPHLKGQTSVLQSLLGYISFDLLNSLHNVYKKGYSEGDIKTFLQTLTKLRNAHNVTKKTSSYLSNFIITLQQYFGYKEDLLGISYNDSNSMGGSLVFSTPLEGLRKNLINMLHQTQRDFPSTELIYTSWLDGYEHRGIVCEQDLWQQKPSSYIDNNTLILETHDKNIIVGSYHELINQKDVDIILDTVHMKIYTQGRKLTSKDIHSQSGTIEMLLSTLKNIGTDISNKQLPISSYSKSKNDMVGKIIVPFTKFIKNKLHKDLPIECYGGMYDYFLRLNKHNIKFGIVRKIADMK